MNKWWCNVCSTIIAARDINQASACVTLSCSNVVDAVRGWWRGQGAALCFPRFSHVRWHRTCAELAGFRGEERESGLWSFLMSTGNLYLKSPLFPINTCLWHKFAVLSRICTVCFCPMTSKFGFVDKLVSRAQLVRKWLVLISPFFMSVI